MSDNNIIPISDEQAKLGQEIVGASRELGGYLDDILDDLPKDLVGLLAGDKVKVWRAERLAKMWYKSKKKLAEQGITPESPSLKLALPILAAAADENSEDLQDIWAGLLAAAMNPVKSSLIRLKFIETIKRFDPLDALIMRYLYDHSGKLSPNTRDFLANVLEVSPAEIIVSSINLTEIGCVGRPNSSTEAPDFYITTYGKELVRVCSA